MADTKIEQAISDLEKLLEGKSKEPDICDRDELFRNILYEKRFDPFSMVESHLLVQEGFERLVSNILGLKNSLEQMYSREAQNLYSKEFIVEEKVRIITMFYHQLGIGGSCSDIYRFKNKRI